MPSCFPNCCSRLVGPLPWRISSQGKGGGSLSAAPAAVTPGSLSAIAGSRSGAGGCRGAVPAGQGPGAAAARCVHALQSTGKGAAAPLSSAGRAQTKGSLLAPRGSGQGCPGLLAWEMRGLQREPPRHRPPCAVGRWVPLVHPPHIWAVSPQAGLAVPLRALGGPRAGGCSCRPPLPVRWQLRPPSWLQAPRVLAVLLGRTQKGFLQRRTPQWLLSFIVSAREIHVYCNFFCVLVPLR